MRVSEMGVTSRYIHASTVKKMLKLFIFGREKCETLNERLKAVYNNAHTCNVTTLFFRKIFRINFLENFPQFAIVAEDHQPAAAANCCRTATN
jgi:hypothetical protein